MFGGVISVEHDAVDCSAWKNPTSYTPRRAAVSKLLYSAVECGKPAVELIAARHCAHCKWSRQRATPPHPAPAVVVVVVPVVEVVVVAEVKFAAATGWVTVAVVPVSYLTLVVVAVASAACGPTATVPVSWSVAPHEWLSHTVVTTAHMNK
jgi:hypothetical protein